MNQKQYPVKRGKTYELEIERLAFGGAGVARFDDYVIFVKQALPGDKVHASIKKRKSSYAEARLVEIMQPSPERIAPPCPYFGTCGGCTWQNLTYKNQLKYKRQIVQEALRHIAGIQEAEVEPVMASETAWAYRNKMEFSFSDRRWLLPEELGNPAISKDFALGFHVAGTFDKILQVDHCLLQSETANDVLRFVSRFARENNLSLYGIRSHEGFLRFLVIRESQFNQKLMVNIVTAYEDTDPLKELAAGLQAEFPQVVSVVNNINTRPAQIAVGEREILLAGQPVIQEKLGPYIFNISANSFFQTNTRQAERLYQVVLDAAGIQSDDVVWDLYSGTGTISLFLAEEAARVIGFEVAASAVADAEQNAREHGVSNVRFLAGDLLHTMPEAGEPPDILVTDPPRSGMHEKVVRQIMQHAPGRIVYVSCNPTTLARDLARLIEDYHIRLVQPVDMFPQTYHIETVVRLDRK